MLRRALVLGLLVMSLAVPAVPAQTPSTEIAVDASQPLGPVNPNLVGFAFRPPADRTPWTPLRPRTFRVDAGIEHLVSCPSATIDTSKLQTLLQYIDAVEATGAETILILSYMPPCMADVYPGDPRDPTKAPPKDPAAWERLITELVTAVAPRGVKYYEVWNEPDLPVFFQGSPSQFADRIAVPSGRAVAAVAARSGLDLRYGVCACVAPDPLYMVPLLRELQSQKIPVGFVSWHYYGNYPFLGPDGPEPFVPKEVVPAYAVLGQRNPVTSPQAFAVQIDLVREWTRAALGSVPELMIDEWNVSAGGFDTRMDTHEGAAFQAATLAAMAEARLDRAALFSDRDPYERDINGNVMPVRHGGHGVLDRSGAPKPAWYAQWMWSRLEGERLASPQDPVGGVWTAASVTADKDRVDVLASSFVASGGAGRQVHLDVAGVHPGRWRAELFRVDASHAGSTQPVEVRDVVVRDDRRVSIEADLPAQSVLLVELTGPNAEGRVSVLGTGHGVPDRFSSPERVDTLPATGASPSLTVSAAGLALALVLRRYRWRVRRRGEDGSAERAAGGIGGGAGLIASWAAIWRSRWETRSGT